MRQDKLIAFWTPDEKIDLSAPLRLFTACMHGRTPAYGIISSAIPPSAVIPFSFQTSAITASAASLSAFPAPVSSVSMINCGSDTGHRTQAVMRFADLTVCALCQDIALLDEFFSCRRIPLINPVYLILDYVPSHQPNLNFIQARYRVPDKRLCALPYNVRCTEAFRRDQGERYLRTRVSVGDYEAASDFHPMLGRCIDIMYSHVC